MIADNIEKRAKDTFLDFLRVYSKKFFIKVKIKQFFERCNTYHLFNFHSNDYLTKIKELRSPDENSFRYASSVLESRALQDHSLACQTKD
jgi:hypothetical protein